MTEPSEIAAGLPHLPGVYRMIGKEGEVLYVGKAKSLRSRVRSYFNRGDGRPGIERMVGRIARIEIIVTSTEAEALPGRDAAMRVAARHAVTSQVGQGIPRSGLKAPRPASATSVE